MKNRSSSLSAKPKVNVNKVKVIPIIEIRGMKAKKLINSDNNVEEVSFFNRIDQLSSDEFVGGNIDENLNRDCDESSSANISHDGVEISINGSDDKNEFPDETAAEPGEISDSDEETILHSSR